MKTLIVLVAALLFLCASASALIEQHNYTYVGSNPTFSTYRLGETITLYTNAVLKNITTSNITETADLAFIYNQTTNLLVVSTNVSSNVGLFNYPLKKGVYHFALGYSVDGGFMDYTTLPGYPVVGTILNWTNRTYSLDSGATWNEDFFQLFGINSIGFDTSCFPNYVCNGYGACRANDTKPCNSTHDANNCSVPYPGDFSEFAPAACDFCTPNWYCTGFDACLPNNTRACTGVTDANACNETFNGTLDSYAGNCTFAVCEPLWDCEAWADCVENARNCTVVEDEHLCNVTFNGSLSDYNIGCNRPLACDVDNTPFLHLTSRPTALCTGDPDLSCITWLSDPENAENLWGIMPGGARRYETTQGAIVVEFSTDRLLQNRTVVANILCNAQSFSFNMTPQYLDYQAVGDAALVARDNASPIILGILILIVLVVFAAGFLWLWRRM